MYRRIVIYMIPYTCRIITPEHQSYVVAVVVGCCDVNCMILRITRVIRRGRGGQRHYGLCPASGHVLESRDTMIPTLPSCCPYETEARRRVAWSMAEVDEARIK